MHFGSDQPLRLGDRLDINAERYLRNQRGQLILQGLMNKGAVEANKPDSEKPDPKIMARAIQAAQEIIDRKDRSGITHDLEDDASLLVPKL